MGDSERGDRPERRTGQDRRKRERRVVDIPPAVYGKKDRRKNPDRRSGVDRRKAAREDTASGPEAEGNG